MNLKERLENKSGINEHGKNQAMSDAYCIKDIFTDDKKIKTLLCSYINNYKNIIFISDKSVDNLICSYYFQSCADNKEAEIITDLLKNNSFENPGINIVPNPDIAEIVKIFEYILRGFKSFIFGVDLNNTEYAAEKIKALIALNYSNLTGRDINILLGESGCLLVYILKNSDGLFFISKTEQIRYENGEIITELLSERKSSEMRTVDEEKTTSEITPENAKQTEARKKITTPETKTEKTIQKRIECKNDNQTEINPEKINQAETKKTAVQSEESKQIQSCEKKNKYKLLKEKIKNKKKQNEEKSEKI